MSVHLEPARKVPSGSTRDSKVRQEVVPTQRIRPPFCRVSFRRAEVYSFIMHSSECM